jgi:hypothetical protein
MNTEELERFWKRAGLTYSRYCPGICVKKLKTSTKNLSGLPVSGWDSHRVPSEWKSWALPPQDPVRWSGLFKVLYCHVPGRSGLLFWLVSGGSGLLFLLTSIESVFFLIPGGSGLFQDITLAYASRKWLVLKYYSACTWRNWHLVRYFIGILLEEMASC